MDEKKAGREMRNSNPQFEFNLLRRQHFCFIPRGSCGGVGGVGGSYRFGKYYDGRSPGFLFIITAMSPPFCAGIPGNYNTSNWCFNSSGRDHRQVNTRLELAQRLACSHTRRERREERSPSDQPSLQISLSCQPMSPWPLSLHLSHILPFNTGEKAVLSKPVSLSYLLTSKLDTLVGPHLFRLLMRVPDDWQTQQPSC